jgi:hypothetical protein
VARDEPETLSQAELEAGLEVLETCEKQNADYLHAMGTRQQLNMLYGARTNLLRPALSTSHIPLSNSLTLCPQDRECFQYIPNSFLVQTIGKPWQWSMLSYIHAKLASHEKGIMRAFIALASMELRCRYISLHPGDPGDLEAARQQEMLATDHYHHALRDLSWLLDRASRPERTDQDIDSLFATWFLLLWFGTYNAELVGDSQVHLSGIRSFLKENLHGAGGKLCLPPASQQLLYFITFVSSLLAPTRTATNPQQNA